MAVPTERYACSPGCPFLTATPPAPLGILSTLVAAFSGNSGVPIFEDVVNIKFPQPGIPPIDFDLNFAGQLSRAGGAKLSGDEKEVRDDSSAGGHHERGGWSRARRALEEGSLGTAHHRAGET